MGAARVRDELRTIRGARTVRINPTGSDTYEIVLEIDREMINYLITTARGIV